MNKNMIFTVCCFISELGLFALSDGVNTLNVEQTADIKKTLDALFIKGYRAVWEDVGLNRKTKVL